MSPQRFHYLMDGSYAFSKRIGVNAAVRRDLQGMMQQATEHNASVGYKFNYSLALDWVSNNANWDTSLK